MCSTKADMPNLQEHTQTVNGRATTGLRAIVGCVTMLLQVEAGGTNCVW